MPCRLREHLAFIRRSQSAACGIGLSVVKRIFKDDGTQGLDVIRADDVYVYRHDVRAVNKCL